MKKLLFNRERTKIFNLDQFVSIEHHETEDGHNAIILKFSSEDYFLITPGEDHEFFAEYFKANIDYRWFKDADLYREIMSGNFEENKKLYEYFEHKFTRSTLCAKTELT